MIKFVIDGEAYSEKEFKRDMARIFDSMRGGGYSNWGSTDCGDIGCTKCPLTDVCEKCNDNDSYGFLFSFSYEMVEAVYHWAAEHPIITNEEKLRAVFGTDAVSMINSAVNCYDCEDAFNEWLMQEYKNLNNR